MADNEQLERAIFADPYDQAAYSVYGDWLQSQGDPRGELISLQIAAQAKPNDTKLDAAADLYLKENLDTFLGELIEHAELRDGTDNDAFEWRNGFIYSAKLSHDGHVDTEFEGRMADVLRSLLRHPSGKFLTELSLAFNGDPNEDTLDDLIEVLVEEAPRALRTLHLGDFDFPDDTELSWYHVGNVEPLWKALPQLCKLIVQGGDFTLGAIEAPALRHAEFRTGGLTSASLQSITQARWPNLERLDVWFGQDDYGCDVTIDGVAALLARTDLPRLTSLGVMNCELADQLPELLTKTQLLPQLERLDLSMGTLSDEGAAVLAAHKAAFAHLDELDVSESFLRKPAIDGLKGVANKITANSQRDDPGDPDDEVMPAASLRYAAVGE